MTQTHDTTKPPSGEQQIIGIDTGGTFTDAVLLAPVDGKGQWRVLATAKRPTRHADLARSVREAVAEVLEKAGVSGASIAKVGLSTTLATNAVVEGRGARVGLFQIGVRKPVRLPVVSVKYLQGGHSVTGKEDGPLDIPTLLEGVEEFKGHVDAYAVGASGSCFNPAHELVAAKAIALADPRPVSLAHDVSDLPTHEARLATVALNAGLLPVMEYFLARVRESLADLGVVGDLVMVKGDGNAMRPDHALEKPLATFAGGPAASALFGAWSLPQDQGTDGDSAGDAVIIDVGGTTTDVVLLKDGKPDVPVANTAACGSAGSIIGGWETHVQTVRLRTVGIGGDSHVSVQQGKLRVGPRRVHPLCRAKNLPAPSEWLGSGHRLVRLVMGADPVLDGKSDPVLSVLDRRGPLSVSELANEVGRNQVDLERILENFARTRQIEETGFTPTDALHVLGRADFGDVRPALEAAQVLGTLVGMSAEGFCEAVLAKVRSGVADAVLEHLLQVELGQGMVEVVRQRNAMRLLTLRPELHLPV